MTGAALVADDVSKSYGDTPALGPLGLTVNTGEYVAVVGHNGSGKTTLLRLVAGLLEPSGGEVSVCGHAVGSIEARAATSFVSDHPVFYDDLRLREHLEYVARLHGRDDWTAEADDLIVRLGLIQRADDLPTTFSRGVRQKAAIALGFVRPFELLLVDEPFLGLDRSGRQALLELLDLAQGRGAAVVVATHELPTVDDASRVIALRDGAVIYDGPRTGADVDALVMK